VEFVPTVHLNCIRHCMWDVLRQHGRADVCHVLVQPLGFNVEVELASRDWLLSGFERTMATEPRLNRGVRAWWEEADGERIRHIVEEDRREGYYTIFATEWSLVPYSPHYEKKFGAIHTAVIYEWRGDMILVMDKMNDGQLRHLFDKNMRAWVPVDMFTAAFSERLKVLRYRFDKPRKSWVSEVFDILRLSVANMTRSAGRFDPLAPVSWS